MAHDPALGLLVHINSYWIGASVSNLWYQCLPILSHDGRHVGDCGVRQWDRTRLCTLSFYKV